jgi:hypothetical protein
MGNAGPGKIEVKLDFNDNDKLTAGQQCRGMVLVEQYNRYQATELTVSLVAFEDTFFSILCKNGTERDSFTNMQVVYRSD